MAEAKIEAQTIVIKANQGITHALKDLVMNKEKLPNSVLSGGKITAEEWNKTLDKLVEINEKRKADNKAPIFTGGTDKSSKGWHTSFVVHPNQEIEFTADEMNSLYTAMGVSFGNTTDEAANAEGNVAENQNAKPNGKVKTEKREDTDGKAYIAEIREDGKELTRTYKDENDNISQVREYVYDEKGNKNKEIQNDYVDNKLKVIHELEYDEKGNNIKEIFKKADGKPVHIIQKTPEGKMSERTEIKYDKNGDLSGIESQIYASDGKTVIKKVVNSELVYSDDGKNKYNYKDDVCIKSTLSDDFMLYDKYKISGTLEKILKDVNQDNIVKFISSVMYNTNYDLNALIQHIDSTWGLSVTSSNLLSILLDRADILGYEIEDINNIDFVKLSALDTRYTAGIDK